MSNVYKLFAKVLLDRISIKLDEQQPNEQAGFRKEFSTIDHIHTVKQVIEKYKEYNKIKAFIDYAKAFGSLDHEYIEDTLIQPGIQVAYVNIVRTIYANIVKTIYGNSKARNQLESLGKEFETNRSVRLGDPLSLKLLSAVLENIFRKLNIKKFGHKR